MQDDTTQAATGLDRPSISRVYDYILGGKENFEIDRRAATALFDAVPETRQIAKDNRNQLRRTVRYLVGEAGIDQIIDFGSGLPTAGNVHEVAHEVNPAVHVAYVDIDPVVLAHGRAVLTSGILHHLSDAEDPWAVADRIKARLGRGCYLMVSNFLDDDEPRAKELEAAFLEGGLGTGRFRTWAEQQRFFDGLEMVEPGLVYANDWHPDELTPTASPVHTLYAVGIGRKP